MDHTNSGNLTYAIPTSSNLYTRRSMRNVMSLRKFTVIEETDKLHPASIRFLETPPDAFEITDKTVDVSFLPAMCPLSLSPPLPLNDGAAVNVLLELHVRSTTDNLHEQGPDTADLWALSDERTGYVHHFSKATISGPHRAQVFNAFWNSMVDSQEGVQVFTEKKCISSFEVTLTLGSNQTHKCIATYDGRNNVALRNVQGREEFWLFSEKEIIGEEHVGLPENLFSEYETKQDFEVDYVKWDISVLSPASSTHPPSKVKEA